MDGRISKQPLKILLSEDIETVLEEVVAAMNQARPGHIIDDSEELVRAAAGEFRRRLFEKALKLRGDRTGPPGQAASGPTWPSVASTTTPNNGPPTGPKQPCPKICTDT